MKDDESVASPTVSLEAIIATFLIDTYEERDVAIFDVPEVYLHAEFPEGETVLLVLRGKFVDIMCAANPEYREYVEIINGKKVLYLYVLRALYGCIESALC